MRLRTALVSPYHSPPLSWSFSPVRFFRSYSSLKFGGAWVVGGPLQVFSHLSGWRVAEGGYGVLLGFRIGAVCSGLLALALFSIGGLWWVAWRLHRLGLVLSSRWFQWQRTAVRFGFRFKAQSYRRCGAQRPTLFSICFVQVLLLSWGL
ncbi:unnamed protein product [Eruca vesicaria subsp. sativa]|uniref:Transmembrane protein n=1 Tax=Eruca vesicaria subsp. sativa TaxID=29727 RepID=A0ABC8K1E8_ERUVS|nr:unnamed protein product [Eruca vesicaria subsp. sativa]